MASGTLSRSVRALAGNRWLMRIEAAYGFWSVYELAIWVGVLLWAFDIGGAGFSGVVAVAQYVPAALLAPLGGVIAERYARDRVLKWLYLGQGLLTLIMAVLIAVELNRYLIVLFGVLVTTLIGWVRPTHYPATVELSQSPADVAAANSLSGTLERVGYLVGPLVTGGLAVLWSVTAAIAACAVLSLVSWVLVLGIRLRQPQRGPTDGDDDYADVPREKVSFFSIRPAVIVLLLLVAGCFIAEGCTELLAISYAADHLANGSGASGLLMGAEGLGGMLGAALTIMVIRIRRLSITVLASLLVASLVLVTFLFFDGAIGAMLALAVFGIGMGFLAVAAITLMQRAVADNVVGRVLGLRESVLLGGQALGAGLAPLLVKEFGASNSYVALGLGLVVIGLMTFPALLRLDASARFRPEVVELLRGVPFLSVLDVESLERLAYGAEAREVAAGTTVITQGEHGQEFYVVQHGRLTVAVDSETRTNAVNEGEGFGQIALLRNVPRTATVTAEVPCTLWVIERDLFLGVLVDSSGYDVAQLHTEDQLRFLAPKDLLGDETTAETD